MTVNRTIRQMFAALLLMGLVAPAGATLIGRLPATPGGTDYQAAYDPELGITWVTDADKSGSGSWYTQMTWAENLDYLGFDDWRLASIDELAAMFFDNLGGSVGDNKTGNQTVDGVTLTDIQRIYWSGTEVFPDVAWVFNFGGGGQGRFGKLGVNYGWAVRAGDVAAVPAPGTAVLLGLGLAGLLGFGRHERRL